MKPKKSVRFAPESDKSESENIDNENILPPDLNSEKFTLQSPRTPIMHMAMTPV